MGRWSEEEKKTKGLGGLAIALMVLGAFVYLAVINKENISNRRALEAEMQKLTRSTRSTNSDEIVVKLLEKADELGMDLVSDDFDINIKREMGNYYVDAYIRVPFKIDLLVTNFELDVPIVEKLTVVPW